MTKVADTVLKHLSKIVEHHRICSVAEKGKAQGSECRVGCHTP